MEIKIDESDIIEECLNNYENDIDFLVKLCDKSVSDVDKFKDLIVKLSEELFGYSENTFDEMLDEIKKMYR